MSTSDTIANSIQKDSDSLERICNTAVVVRDLGADAEIRGTYLLEIYYLGNPKSRNQRYEVE